MACLDEGGKQLIGDVRPPLPVHQGARRVDHECIRHGTANVLMALGHCADRLPTTALYVREAAGRHGCVRAMDTADCGPKCGCSNRDLVASSAFCRVRYRPTIPIRSQAIDIRSLVLSFMLAMPPMAAAQPMYRVVDLTTTGAGGQSGEAGFGINDAGQVIGNAITPDLYAQSFRTGPGGTLAAAYLGLDSEARAINAGGQVTGQFSVTSGVYYPPASPPRSTRFGRPRPAGSSPPLSDLGELYAGGSSIGYGINANGRVVGVASGRLPGTSTNYYSGSRTTPTGGLSDAELWSGVTAAAINSSGQVTGPAPIPAKTGRCKPR